MEYFKCYVIEDNELETSIGEVYLLYLPRVGEHMRININRNEFKCIVNDIWHFCGDDKVGHRITIYVNKIA